MKTLSCIELRAVNLYVGEAMCWWEMALNINKGQCGVAVASGRILLTGPL